MDKYEEILPDYSSYQDYSVYYIDNMTKIFDNPDLYLVQKEENYIRKHVLLNLEAYASSPNIIEQIISIISLYILHWEEDLKLTYIKTINNLFLKLLANQDPSSTYLYEKFIEIPIKLIPYLEDQIKEEYIIYLDKLVLLSVENKLEINISNEIIEMIYNLAKFGQDKLNRKISVYLFSKIIQVNNNLIHNNDLFTSRLFMLLKDKEPIVLLQSAKEIEYLIPIILKEGNSQYIDEFFLIIDSYLDKSEDFSSKINALNSVLNNIYIIINSNMNKINEFFNKIVNTIFDIFNVSYDKKNKEFDEENVDTTINIFTSYCKIYNHFKNNNSFTITNNKHNNNKNNNNNECYYLTVLNQLNIYELYLNNFIFISKNINFNGKYYNILFENFDIFTKTVNNQLLGNNKYIKLMISKIMFLIFNSSELLPANIKIIKHYFYKHLHKIILFLEKNDIDLLNDIENIILYTDFDYFINNFNNINTTTINSNSNIVNYFINKFLNKLVQNDESSINKITFIDIFKDDYVKFESFLKSFKRLIKYIKKIKQKGLIYNSIFNQIKLIINNTKIIKIRKLSIKIIAQIIKYNTSKYSQKLYMDYIINDIANNKSFYDRRLIYYFYKEIIKNFSIDYIKELTILDKIINHLKNINHPIELCYLFDCIVINNFVLYLMKNEKLICEFNLDFNKIIYDIKNKNDNKEFGYRDTELDKKISFIYENFINANNELLYMKLLDNNTKLLNEEIENGNQVTNYIKKIHKSSINTKYNSKSNNCSSASCKNIHIAINRNSNRNNSIRLSSFQTSQVSNTVSAVSSNNNLVYINPNNTNGSINTNSSINANNNKLIKHRSYSRNFSNTNLINIEQPNSNNIFNNNAYVNNKFPNTMSNPNPHCSSINTLYKISNNHDKKLNLLNVKQGKSNNNLNSHMVTANNLRYNNVNQAINCGNINRKNLCKSQSHKRIKNDKIQIISKDKEEIIINYVINEAKNSTKSLSNYKFSNFNKNDRNIYKIMKELNNNDGNSSFNYNKYYK